MKYRLLLLWSCALLILWTVLAWTAFQASDWLSFVVFMMCICATTTSALLCARD